MRAILMAAGAMLVALPADAQTMPTSPTSPASPPAMAPGSMTPGSPDRANGGPAATGTVTREGTGAGSVDNNPAGGGNAAQPSRAVPNVGSTK